MPFPSATPIARANVQVKRLKLEALNPRSVVISRVKKEGRSRGNGCAQKKFGSLRWCKIGAIGTLLTTLQIFNQYLPAGPSFVFLIPDPFDLICILFYPDVLHFPFLSNRSV